MIKVYNIIFVSLAVLAGQLFAAAPAPQSPQTLFLNISRVKDKFDSPTLRPSARQKAAARSRRDAPVSYEGGSPVFLPAALISLDTHKPIGHALTPQHALARRAAHGNTPRTHSPKLTGRLASPRVLPKPAHLEIPSSGDHTPIIPHTPSPLPVGAGSAAITPCAPEAPVLAAGVQDNPFSAGLTVVVHSPPRMFDFEKALEEKKREEEVEKQKKADELARKTKEEAIARGWKRVDRLVLAAVKDRIKDLDHEKGISVEDGREETEAYDNKGTLCLNPTNEQSREALKFLSSIQLKKIIKELVQQHWPLEDTEGYVIHHNKDGKIVFDIPSPHVDQQVKLYMQKGTGLGQGDVLDQAMREYRIKLDDLWTPTLCDKITYYVLCCFCCCKKDLSKS